MKEIQDERLLLAGYTGAVSRYLSIAGRCVDQVTPESELQEFGRIMDEMRRAADDATGIPAGMVTEPKPSTLSELTEVRRPTLKRDAGKEEGGLL